MGPQAPPGHLQCTSSRRAGGDGGYELLPTGAELARQPCNANTPSCSSLCCHSPCDSPRRSGAPNSTRYQLCRSVTVAMTAPAWGQQLGAGKWHDEHVLSCVLSCVLPVPGRWASILGRPIQGVQGRLGPLPLPACLPQGPSWGSLCRTRPLPAQGPAHPPPGSGCLDLHT